MSTDAAFMATALQLARKGLLTADPNPMVGSVVVKDNQIVGRGWHRRAGGDHAEVAALRDAGNLANGATVYVTLEPCCHYGKTPPCTKMLIDAGVKKVVAAMRDPNPRVAGKGFRVLTNAGIETDCGVLQSCAEELNRGFCNRMRTGKPYVFSKIAMSMDGCTAMHSGESKWITGEHARQDVQRLRAQCSAILTGIDTVLADDPAMNVRLEIPPDEFVQPLRIVLDTHLRLPVDARIGKNEGETLVITALKDKEKYQQLEYAGYKVVCLAQGSDRRLDLSAVLEYLGKIGINELMVEAGATLNGAFLEAGCVDEWVVYQAPCVLGSGARGIVRTRGISSLSDRYQLKLTEARSIGLDLRLRYQFGR